MRKSLHIFCLTLMLAAAAAGQTVEVPQEFVDSSAKSFRETIALREAVQAQKDTIAAKDAEVAAKNDYIELLKELVRTRTDEVEYFRKLKCDKSVYLFGIYKNVRCK
jgi:hypothetical protein